MKKITLLFALFLLTFQGHAQIAAGSVAPDFTVTDINGNTHNLATYLAAGKTVLMDISATWCQPCWNFHNSKALEDINYGYGADGSNEVVVLFVEGDSATTIADLHGTGTNTRGDWVSEVPYPIIDGASIASLYQISYFPTLFRICPNGLVSEITAGSASSIRTTINANCGALTGTQNNGGALENINAFCGSTGSPIAKFRNYGNNAITTATLNLKENGNTIATKTFTGSAPRFTTRTLTFDEITVNPESDYSFELVDVNANPLFNSAISTNEMGVSVAKQAPTEVVVKVYTDNYPTEIKWNITNSTGTVVASGGPYVGNANGGGADANTTKTHNVSLASNECYTINLLDTFGDGWTYGTTQHGLEVFDNTSNAIANSGNGGNTTNNIGNSIYYVEAYGFGAALAKANALNTTTLAVGEFQTNKIKLFPNPTNGIVNISTETPVNVSIVDVTGKIVFTANNVTKDKSIDLSGLQKGIYMAKMIGNNTATTEKIILN